MSGVISGIVVGQGAAEAAADPEFSVKASGTVTILAATTTNDVSFLDADFTAGELTAASFIKVHIAGDSPNAHNIVLTYSLRSTTSDPDFGIITMVGGNTFGGHYGVLSQDVADTSIVKMNGYSVDAGASAMQASEGDSGDDDIFTTAFTLRLNFRHNSSSTSSSTVRAIIEVVTPT